MTMGRGKSSVLITGGAGFIGCNLADRIASLGHQVIIYDALVRPGVEANVNWLLERHADRIRFVKADICDEHRLIEAVVSADAIFHFAAQVAVTTSFEAPAVDFTTNVQGTFRLLEVVRKHAAHAAFVFASTNKVYGDLGDLLLQRHGEAYVPAQPDLRNFGISEKRRLDFHTPYGCSKGAADQYVLDYARSFGLRTAVFRMSCIYGERQLGTEDQGWVAHFLIKALSGEPITIYGDGCQVRDILAVSDAVAAYIQAWERIDEVSGQSFNLGGGPANAVSLRQIIAYVEERLKLPVKVSYADWRPGDQRYFVADARAARRALDLPPFKPWKEGVADLARWLKSSRNSRPRAGVCAA